MQNTASLEKINKRRLGEAYEEQAARYLEQQGLKVLARNWHAGKRGELDIVAKDGDTLVFVEVKFRSGKAYGSPFEAIDSRKQARIGKLAMCYMKRYGISFGSSCRFDCIGITKDGSISYLKNAFSL